MAFFHNKPENNINTVAERIEISDEPPRSFLIELGFAGYDIFGSSARAEIQRAVFDELSRLAFLLWPTET